jgi:histidyl-tRNA synthetase
MGGPPTPAVGWAAGIERLSMLLTETPTAPATVAIIPMGQGTEPAAIALLNQLRHANVRAEMAYRGNMKKRMERANKIGARAVVILGDDELARGVAGIKDLSTGTQTEVPLADVAHVLST